VSSFIDGSLLRFRLFNAIAQIKRINRPSVIFHKSAWVALAPLGRRPGLRLHAGWSEEKETRMLRGSFFIYKHEYFSYDIWDEERERWSRPVDLVH
jgi:hypothetical protein